MRFILILLALAKISFAETADVVPAIVLPEPLGKGEVVQFYPQEIQGAWWIIGGKPKPIQEPTWTVSPRSFSTISRSLDNKGMPTAAYGSVKTPGGDKYPDKIRVERAADGTLISCTMTRYSTRGTIGHACIYTYEAPDLVHLQRMEADGTVKPHITNYRIK